MEMMWKLSFVKYKNENNMWVKVDYSSEAKKNPKPNMAGKWAIYTKKHWWNKWVERDTYADLDWCTRDAKKLVEYPKYYYKFDN